MATTDRQKAEAVPHVKFMLPTVYNGYCKVGLILS